MARSGRKITGRARAVCRGELGWISSWPLLLHFIFRNSVYTYFVNFVFTFFLMVDPFFFLLLLFILCLLSLFDAHHR